MLILAIRKLEGHTFAKEMFDQQITKRWPGQTAEATIICKEIGINDVYM